MWNKAPDTGQPQEVKSPYFFKLDQTTNKPTIKIVRDSNVTACAKTIGPNGGPYELHVPSNATNRDLWSLLCTIAHEFGHPMGLDDNWDNNCYTIMSQASAGCVYSGADVTQGDVNAAWQVIYNKSTCSGHVQGTGLDQCDGAVANNCIDNGGYWDEETCYCYNATGCDQTQQSTCYSNNGRWDDASCSCAYPQYYYGGGGGYYCYYTQHCYYTTAQYEQDSETSEMQCDYELDGCYYY